MTPMSTNPISELVYALSALNTYPQPTDTLHETTYIADSVSMVAHAIEHIQAAIALLKDAK